MPLLALPSVVVSLTSSRLRGVLGHRQAFLSVVAGTFWRYGFAVSLACGDSLVQPSAALLRIGELTLISTPEAAPELVVADLISRFPGGVLSRRQVCHCFPRLKSANPIPLRQFRRRKKKPA